MTRSNFRDLLLIYLMLAILGAAYGIYVGVSGGESAAELLSKENFEGNFEKEVRDFHRYISERQTFRSSITAISIILVVVSWIGLFKFWNPARVIFCGYLFFAYLVSPFLDFRLEGLPVDSKLYGFYCNLFMQRPGAIANMLAPINIAFATTVALII